MYEIITTNVYQYSGVFSMKKRILLLAAAAVLIVLLLCGCSHLSTARNIAGAWRSEDGYTVTFAGGVITLRDENGAPVLEEPMKYGVTVNRLYVEKDGQTVEILECRPDGDRLTLVYTEQLLKLCGLEEAEPIELTRISE